MTSTAPGSIPGGEGELGPPNAPAKRSAGSNPARNSSRRRTSLSGPGVARLGLPHFRSSLVVTSGNDVNGPPLAHHSDVFRVIRQLVHRQCPEERAFTGEPCDRCRIEPRPHLKGLQSNSKRYDD